MADVPPGTSGMLLSATDETRRTAEHMRAQFELGISVAAIAANLGVQKSVVEWWLAISRLPCPYDAAAEILALSTRGLLAREIVDRYGYSANMVRRIVRERILTAREARWQFAQMYG